MTQTQFGCIALLDALGTRTASIENAVTYLEALADLRALMSRFQVSNESSGERMRPEEPGGDFRIRFFADSILITLPFEPRDLNWTPIARMFAGTATVVAEGINRGILFRGALSIGQYIESEDAVLGPAVLDAAYWYEMADMIGVIATPNAMFSIQRILLDPSVTLPTGTLEALGVAYPVPLKNGKVLSTNVADWVFSAMIQSRDAMSNVERWFYSRIQTAVVTPEVESKYRHSMEFLKYCVNRTRLISSSKQSNTSSDVAPLAKHA